MADYHRPIASVPSSKRASRLLRRAPRPPLPPGPYLVVGLGQAGFAAARALREHAGAGAVRVWDGAADPPQRERAAELRGAGVEVRLGGDGLGLLDGVRTIVKSPGVSPQISVVAEARRRGLALIDELEAGWHLVPAPAVAVTGTKGKTTTTFLCVEMLRAHGLDPVLAGNTNFGPPLSEVALAGTPRSLVLEVSSYQCEFAASLAVDAAAFTNLTPDHLDRHSTMERYGAAKRRLFVRGDWCVPLASFNLDDAFGRRLAAEVKDRGGTALGYGTGPEADYRVVAHRGDLHGAAMTFETPAGRVELEAKLPGIHNAANLAAALALSDGLELPRAPTLQALTSAQAPPGRLEALEIERPFDVIVDLAIMTDSVAKVLRTARARVDQTGGRVLTVYSIMGRSAVLIAREAGAMARSLSDHLIVTATSYRGEPRLVGLAELLSGARAADGGTLETVIDRRAAVARVLALARPGDVVAILGRGWVPHEATDERGGFRELDDREIVRELI